LKFLDEKVLKLRLFEKAKQKEEIPGNIKKLAKERLQAKKEKNFILSDELRKKIHSQGYQILDTKEGYQIKKAK